MARIRDLTGKDSVDILHRTEASGGLFGAGALTDRPLADYLSDDEVARFLLWNKHAGVTVDGPDGERAIEPDDDHRTVALLTDRRVRVVAGRAAGDETVSVPLADVFDAASESAGLLTSRLVVETADGRRVVFPCRGDLDPVVETLLDDGSAWAHAERLLEDADAAVDRAREHLDAGRHENAIAAMDDAEAYWAEARDGLESVHEAAVDGLAERVAVRREIGAGIRREARAGAGATAHVTAQTAWERREYERAAAAYERAIESYRASRGLPGDVPPDEALDRRIAGAAGERAVLRAAPVADAEAAAGAAAAAADPGDAAEAWERAHERARAALELEWGESGRRFVGDRREIQASAATAADSAIGARLAAARQWLAAGDRVASADGPEAARQIYDRAGVHLDRAESLARRVLPQRVADVESRQASLEGRLDGSIDPGAEAADAPLPVDAVLDVLDEAGADADPAVDPPARTPVRAGSDGTHAAPPSTNADARDPGQASEDGRADGADRVADSDGAAPVGLGDDAGALAGADVEREALVAALRDLDGTALAALVADVWQDRGWSTSLFAAADSAVYDVLGIDRAGGSRLALWTVPGDADATVEPAVLERMATTRARGQGDGQVALVTTAPVPAATRRRASALDVPIVDVEGLADLVVTTDRVADVTDDRA